MTAPDPSDHAALLHPSEFLRWQDLRGKDVTLTISHVSREELAVAGSAQKKTEPVIRFAEMEERKPDERKRMVLNKTNRLTIQGLHGDYVSGWIGKKITLYGDPTVKFGRETPGGLRIRNKAPK